MSVFICKMCGGTLEIHDNETVAVCEYCGTKQTLPKLDSDKRMNLYDRASHFRRNNDFDKAMNLYEQILSEDNTDAEAYWSIVLCRYGIEYVEDPKSHKRIPTVNRTQHTSIYSDADYQSALKYADGAQRAVYEEEAEAIDAIQKGILEISAKEEPFDVFICYKETDSRGRRTPDSVLANDLYHELTEEGFKVFFSRITLEDKLGIAYEPYIFAALNSAKVMVVIGTKPEYFNAVWVRNEWSRYLALIKNGAKKMLIPAYRDMDPYDLPEEFAHLQAQDMSKLGFMQDLIRGIKKIAQAHEAKTANGGNAVTGNGNVNISPLLRRAFMFLEDGNWQEADEYCERVLDQEPENAWAYLGKLMAGLRVRKQENLANCGDPFDGNDNYKKILRFGDDKLISELQGCIEHINERNENIRKEAVYDAAVDKMNISDTEDGFKSAANIFKKIRGFKDADALEAQCIEKAKACHNDEIYISARLRMSGADDAYDFNAAIGLFELIPGWKDANEQIDVCRTMIERIAENEKIESEQKKEKEEKERIEHERREQVRQIERERVERESLIRQKRDRIKRIALTAVTVCAVFIFVFVIKNLLEQKYNSAMDMYNAEKYKDAMVAFQKLGKYKDSITQMENCRYNAFVQKYGKEIVDKIYYGNSGDIYTFGSYEQDNDASNGKEPIDWVVLDKKDTSLLLISKQALDCSEYQVNNGYSASVGWERSSVRTWLNDTFYNEIFDSEEQKLIQTTTVSDDKNPKYNYASGNATSDKIFFLSIQEVEKYLTSDRARLCKATEYAVDRGAYVKTDSSDCCWWLRTSGKNHKYVAYVDEDGRIDYIGASAGDSTIGIRPALWINLELEP